VKVREPRLTHRRRRGITLGVLSLGTAAACALGYMLSSVGTTEAIIVPLTFLSTLVLGVVLCTRTRARQRWQAAWDSYSMRDLSRNSFKSVEEERTFSLVGTN
jgi:glyceraldehyde-3-phosphate dehydrogenase/erythrose-4-phosphate dehydrogenase